ncbi:DUF1684 domain-containing protein [Winogradskyella alexanderae]|uniref:DUF1684 domain-containing protein n=1 Tax=Winogradskyella alexanderae TaxID=2877123 RepID=A0ABS7XUM9_9FLAO|nr:DUF1684 domain-containing protein [Winogradskyella alexanderae]MCA0133720.1 DUF1684 domain-containing protein [Winogradskyella alexanderae]
MKYLFLLLIVSVSFSCSQKKQSLKGESEWQKQKNAVFKDASKTPLKPKDLKNFTGLDFFSVDSSFVVNAYLERTPNTDWFNMKTTDDRLSKERVYGILNFELKGKPMQLKVYQGEENMQTEGYEDYLFLPFLDDTNGESTYGGGRYIDLRIPKGDAIIIDFNKAYNPLCVYDEKYSCPIVPRENYINVKVTAGMKDFKGS